MKRTASDHLDTWLESADRKPIVLRGARQVGKTWLIRDLAERHQRKLVELNLERYPKLARHFDTSDPRRALSDLEADLDMAIVPERSLLFLDEIQATPALLAYLRWFREDMPELPVVAAGSLLEFALAEHDFSMPVGRISYYHLGPMSFNEFLLAGGHEKLHDKLLNYELGERFSPSLHEKCLTLCGEYCLVGGMPEVVREWTRAGNLKNCLKLQQDLLATYHDDFHKYRGGIATSLLSRVMESAAEQVGSKFVFSRADDTQRAAEVRKALVLLCKARICHQVFHTSARGLPLGAGINEKFLKVFLLDTGLAAAQLGLSPMGGVDIGRMLMANRGGVSEHLVAQLIRACQTPLQEPKLYYWQRTRGGQGEIDYVFQHGSVPVPLEVKAGAAGSMKSLHQFMADRKLEFAVRCDTNAPSVMDVNVRTTSGMHVAYRLLSIPHYMAEILPRLLRQLMAE